MKIGHALRLARVRAGLTQYQAAAAIGVRQPSICFWERGTRDIPEERLKELLALYGVSLGEAMQMLK